MMNQIVKTKLTEVLRKLTVAHIDEVLEHNKERMPIAEKVVQSNRQLGEVRELLEGVIELLTWQGLGI